MDPHRLDYINAMKGTKPTWVKQMILKQIKQKARFAVSANPQGSLLTFLTLNLIFVRYVGQWLDAQDYQVRRGILDKLSILHFIII